MSIDPVVDDVSATVSISFEVATKLLGLPPGTTRVAGAGITAQDFATEQEYEAVMAAMEALADHTTSPAFAQVIEEVTQDIQQKYSLKNTQTSSKLTR